MWTRDQFMEELDLYSDGGYCIYAGTELMIYTLTFGVVDIDLDRDEEFKDCPDPLAVARDLLQRVIDLWELVTGVRLEFTSISNSTLYIGSEQIIDSFIANGGLRILQEIEDGIPYNDALA